MFRFAPCHPYLDYAQKILHPLLRVAGYVGMCMYVYIYIYVHICPHQPQTRPQCKIEWFSKSGVLKIVWQGHVLELDDDVAGGWKNLWA